MSVMVQTPIEMMEELGDLRFPPKTDARLQCLMDRNTEGQLTGVEREELEYLVELNEKITLVRARALRVLGRTPV
jgi:hypothetical protein